MMESEKARVKAHWEKESCGERYGRHQQGHNVDTAAWAEKRYQIEPYIYEFAQFEKGRGKRVLEIGVGGGSDFANWVKSGAQATGIDLTDRGVHLTRKRLRDHGIPDDAYQLSQGDAENLHFADNTFDIVYSWGVLHCTPDTEKAFREVRRVLKPGGEFRAMVYHTPSVVGWLLWLRHGLPTGKVFTSPDDVVYEHLESPGTKVYSVPRIKEILSGIGFNDVDAWSRLSSGDLLLIDRSSKYRSPMYNLLWRVYPRWLVRQLGDSYGLWLCFTATK
jgi:ubiquinone/menaquinone biosynthesis C-methylase UbiE